MDKKVFIKNYLDESIRCIELLKGQSEKIEKISNILQNAKNNGRKVFLFGNGGSSSTASHLVCDFSKFRDIKAFALTDNVPLVTAWSNDENYDVVFKEQLKNFAEKDDVVIGISGSGKSKNVIEAVKFAKENDCITIGFAGFDGGLLKDITDECIVVKINNMQHSEDMHLLVGHLIALLLE
jgi:D-sedoheptulose 7-phosphate isomerase